MMFARRLADRLSLEEALGRYFREVAVPVAMRETVRARALLSLADRVGPEGAPLPPLDGWDRLRLDRFVGAVRRRAQHLEATTLQCRMAACVAEAAVMATHIRMAVLVGELLAGTMPADEAVMVYVRAFELPVKEGDAVFRGALAELARRRLPALESPRLSVEPEPMPEPARDSAIAAALGAAPAFGLRVIV
jgi:hypothetical protein